MSFIATGLGIGSLVAEGATAATLGTMATSAAIGETLGAGVGALTNPKNRLKGALMGGLTGAVGGAATGGLGSLVGGEAAAGTDAAASAAPNAPTSSVAQGSPTVQSALTQSPTSITNQSIGQAANAPSIGTPTAMAPPPNIPPGGIANAAPAPTTPTFGDTVTKAVTSNLLSAGPQIAGGGMPTYDSSGAQKINAAKQEGTQMAQEAYKPWGKAAGGPINLSDGDFIIPADVVSAIGNGSSGAGAKYLDHLFNAIAAGPAPEPGSMARERLSA